MIAFLGVVAAAMFGAVWMNLPSGGIQFSPLDPAVLVTECGELNAEGGVYTLGRDITVIDSGCFNITANNVVLDGAGFKITGDGIAGHNGIEARNVENAVIKNIGVERFAFGILFSNADNSQIIDNDVELNTDDGIYLTEGSDNNLISGNTASNNEYHGISIDGSSYNIIDGNDASLNSVALNNQSGILLYAGANNNNLTNNKANANHDVGIYLYKSGSNLIKDNVAEENNYGIYLQSESNNNEIIGNSANLSIGLGITLDGSSYNKVEKNVMGMNMVAGLALFKSLNNIIKNNVLVSNEFGLYIASGSGNNVFENIDIDGLGFGSDAVTIVSSPNNRFTGMDVKETADESSDLVVSETGKGQVRFFRASDVISGDFGDGIKIGDNSVEVDSVSIPELNVPAEITITVPSNWINRKILKDGADCPVDVCTLVGSIDSDNVVFNVIGFSKYSVWGEAPPFGTQGSGGGGGGGGGGGTKPTAVTKNEPVTDTVQPPVKEVTPKADIGAEETIEPAKSNKSIYWVAGAAAVLAIALIIKFGFLKSKKW